MITTDFVPGSPSWLDLGAPDIAAASRFYGAVFDWETETYEDAGYAIFRSGGKAAAAVGKLEEEGARSAWMSYFHTDDADATAQAVERLGGTVRAAPFDVDGEGRMAQFSDPQGGQFAVWQPGKTVGLGIADEPNSLCWTELYTTDAADAQRFYGELFGWTTSDMPLPGDGGTYVLVTPAGQPEERMHGGIMEMPAEALTATGGRAYWHPVFAVADCDATLARITGNGGSVQMGPEDAEGVGRLAVCVDPFGAGFVVLTPASPPEA
ncbi:VOC family protein [Streptomyces sp. JJ66]|uniref:VOC family protein n=1 Tax=Streptomyces sp. JJ66 TaxID=2803843 RepID=UPI001C582FCB|nr:VOC family protein [Streptomyces sp. JJ66]MBW1604207.1 VOC family protein [Streptomyces sp. JJ66]